jgi:hypothetical protein
LFQPRGGEGILFDIDGDGHLEWIVVVVDDLYSTAPVWSLLAVDLRDGSTHVMNETSRTTRDCWVTDADGDRHAELYCFEEVDDEHYLVAYEGADGPWASAYQTYWRYFEGYQWTPDGRPHTGGVDFAEQGGFNYVPSADSFYGVGADLVVRIADVCDEECERGWMTAWVQVGNQGRVGVGRPVVARVYGERDGAETLVAEVKLNNAPKGWWTAAEPVRFPAGGYARLRAEVAGDGWEVEECDTTNNEDVWELTCG